MSEKRAVLVTTEFRGVFFGYIESDADVPNKVELSKARNCIYWDSKCKGFLGLAQNGPTKGCRIGPACDRITLYKVTSISDVTPNAVAKWEASPWS